MKIKKILSAIAVLLLTPSFVKAEDLKGIEQCKPKLGVTVDVTHVSRYIWRGMDIYPQNHSAAQPSLTVDLYGTGFGINIWSSMANKSGFEDSKELDYTVYYSKTLFEDKIYATDYTIGWSYYSYPNKSREWADMQEVFATFCWPKIFPFAIVPHYTIVSTWPAVGKSDVRESSGWLHIFGLCYDLSLPPILPDTNEQIVCLSAEATYNDGTYGEEVDHDWSHAVFGISTTIALTKNLTFTPAFYYQSSWDDSINTEDEYWTSLGFTYKF